MSTVPSPAYPFKHRLPVQMRFNDVDVLGHVNNTVYLQYMDLAKVRYINEVLGDLFNHHDQSMVIVNLTCQYYHISTFDEPLEVLTRVDSIGDHSMVVGQRVVNPDTQEVKCVCRTVMVGYNIDENCKIPIPDEWRRCISDFEGRQLFNDY